MYLKEIIKHKKEEIKSLMLPDFSRRKSVLDVASFLRKKPFVAEIKKASPSRGDINSGTDIIERAKSYERGGAGVISVLTDSRYFKGSFGFLSDISGAVELPMLCKDFILSELQIENAYLYGADCILLIAAVLSTDELTLLSKKARSLKMKILYELHGIDEFEKIKALEPGLVGVNSRDLDSFRINKPGAMKTIASLQGEFFKIAESGIETGGDIRDFREAGADAFLVGTALMTADRPEEKLKEFYTALGAPCS